MGSMIFIFVVELFIASAIYYFFCRLFFKKNFVVLASCASLIGLIAGWTAGYRATGYEVTMAYLMKTNEQLQQERGISLSFEEENNLKKNLFAKTEYTNFLQKRAAIHAVPAFLVVLIIMIRRSKKHEKQYMIGIKEEGSTTSDQKDIIIDATSNLNFKNNFANDQELYKKAWDEIEKGNVDVGLWAKSFVDSDGDENKAKVAYIKKRIIVL